MATNCVSLSSGTFRGCRAFQFYPDGVFCQYVLLQRLLFLHKQGVIIRLVKIFAGFQLPDMHHRGKRRIFRIRIQGTSGEIEMQYFDLLVETAEATLFDSSTTF